MSETLICLVDKRYGEMPRGGYRENSGRKSGFIHPNKGKTYEEIYGEKQAKEIVERWKNAMKRYWEHEINNELEMVVNKILEVINNG